MDWRMDWRCRAACQDQDPELFFPDGGAGAAAAQLDEARAVCHQCPVLGTCLAWALETRQDFGVWGGTSEWERRRMKRQVVRTRRPA